MRFLCLHGQGSNAEVFELQTAALRSELGDPSAHTFDFIDGEIAWPRAPDLEDLDGVSGDSYAFYDDRDATSIVEALDGLADFVTHSGPYDGVLGYDQGAILAAMLLIKLGRLSPFKVAVFMSAQLPYNETLLRGGRISPIDSQQAKINIPTVHIYGAKDEHCRQSLVLSKMCSEYGRAVYVHQGGHEIPYTDPEVTEEMTKVFETILPKPTLVR